MKNAKKHIMIFICAVLVSAICTVAVFAVADYDSSADPLISQSYLIKYINDNVMTPYETKFSTLEKKLMAIEELLATQGGEINDTNENTLNTLLAIINDLDALEKSMNDLTIKNGELEQKYQASVNENQKLKKEIADIRQQIADIISDSGLEDLKALEEKYNSLLSEITSLKSSTSSIQASFTNISKSYVELQKEVYRLNQTLKELSVTDSSVLTDLLNLSSKVSEMGFTLTEFINKNMSFELVRLEKGDSIIAKGSVSVMLQYGDAVITSPKSQYGTNMEYTDLTSGLILKDGDVLPLNHNVFIPGNGRTGILCTGEYGIYIFVGGDFEIIKAGTQLPEDTTPGDTVTEGTQGGTETPETPSAGDAQESAPIPAGA